MPMVLPALAESTAGPIRMATPRMPSSTPPTLAAVSASPANRRARISANSGVVALSTEASALAMWVWP